MAEQADSQAGVQGEGEQAVRFVDASRSGPRQSHPLIRRLRSSSSLIRPVRLPHFTLPLHQLTASHARNHLFTRPFCDEHE